MIEQFINVAFDWVNVFPTFLLIIVVLYWLSVILGALDLGFLDFDLDADFETDVEIEVEFESEFNADAEGGAGGWLMEVLSFFNLGKVPFMVFVSALALPMWLIQYTLTEELGLVGTWFGLLLLLPTFIASMMIAKFITQPLVGVFDKLNEEGRSKDDLTGKVGEAVTSLDASSLGQIEVVLDDGNFILSSKTREGVDVQKGQRILVIEYVKNEDYYLVAPYKEV